MKKLKDKKILAVLTGIAVIVLILVGILFGCGENDSSKSGKNQNKVESITTKEETEKDKNKDDKEAVLEANQEDTEEKIDKEEKNSEKETPKKNDSDEQTKTENSSSHKTSNDKTTTSTHTHTWVEVYKTVNHPAETKQVWVVDKAAYTEEVPVYETKYVNVCSESTCGIDFYGWTQNEASAHVKAHMLAGEQGGYHKEYREVLTGYKTVTHPEEGHYNTVVVKEAYTEEVLSGYKCSCGATK